MSDYYENTKISRTITDAFEDDSVNMDFQVSAYIELMKKIRDYGSISPFTRCAYETYFGMSSAHLTQDWRKKILQVF